MANIANIEFKARVGNPAFLEQKFLTLNPTFIGTDIQTDTYFNARFGRLKLREGNIENALIQYDRPNEPGVKSSQGILYQHKPDDALKQILVQQLGIKVTVQKKRRIYFIGHVKFHFDEVTALGTFIEVEVTNPDGKFDAESMQKSCQYYLDFFGISPEDMQPLSYSDMMLQLKPAY